MVSFTGWNWMSLSTAMRFFAVDLEFDCEHVGSVHKLAYGVVAYNQVGGDETFAVADFYEFLTFLEFARIREFHDCTAVEDHGDETFGTQCLGCFFAQVYAGACAELEYLHCCVVCCVTKN